MYVYILVCGDGDDIPNNYPCLTLTLVRTSCNTLSQIPHTLYMCILTLGVVPLDVKNKSQSSDPLR